MTEAGEDEQERRDRELDELSGELRVILPAVTVLFAFLLTVPFASGFDQLRGTEKAAFFLAFVSTASAIVLLVGESAYHRLVGKPYDKAQLIRTATRQAVAAIGLLAVALGSVAYFVTEALYGRTTAVAVAAGLLVLASITWFALPLRRRSRAG